MTRTETPRDDKITGKVNTAPSFYRGAHRKPEQQDRWVRITVWIMIVILSIMGGLILGQTLVYLGLAGPVRDLFGFLYHVLGFMVWRV